MLERCQLCGSVAVDVIGATTAHAVRGGPRTGAFYVWGVLTGGDLVVAGAHLPVSAPVFVCPAVPAMAAGGGHDAAWRRMLATPRLLGGVRARGSGCADDGVASGVSWSLPLVAVLYFVAALCEELGWTAVLMPAVLRSHGVLFAVVFRILLCR